MNATINRMVHDLTRLGVRRGGILLVHSSLKSLGDLPDRAESAVQALLATLGPDGTLLMPALSYQSVGRESPIFDVRNTPSCVGALTEYFRTRPGTTRSVHPTHSVCGIGPQADAILAGHRHDRTPCGPNSPFARLRAAAGQVLFLGCGLRPNTSMHAVEERVEPPYLFGEMIAYRIRLGDGSDATMHVRAHNFQGWEQRYDRIQAVMRSEGLATGQVGGAESFLLEAPALWQQALATLKANPLFFVEKRS